MVETWVYLRVSSQWISPVADKQTSQLSEATQVETTQFQTTGVAQDKTTTM